MPFDASYYASRNSFVDSLTPFEHYVTQGWEQGLPTSGDGSSMTGDEVVQMAAQLPQDQLNSLLGHMDAADVQHLVSQSSLEMSDLLTTYFDLLHAMNADEVVALVLQYPQALSQMDATDLSFLDGGASFDLGQTLAALDDASLAGLISSWQGATLQFLDGLQAFDLGNRLQGMGDGYLAQCLSAWQLEDLGFTAGLAGFDILSRLDGMGDDALASAMAGWGSEVLSVLQSIPTFDFAGRLAGMADQYLAFALNVWDEAALAVLNGFSGFDLEGRLSGFDSTILAGLTNWDASQLTNLGLDATLLQYLDGTGTIPTGTYPTGTYPTGTYPTGTYPTGTYPTGTIPTGTYPTGMGGNARPAETNPQGNPPLELAGTCGMTNSDGGWELL